VIIVSRFMVLCSAPDIGAIRSLFVLRLATHVGARGR
jgi:hypothetical protein